MVFGWVQVYSLLHTINTVFHEESMMGIKDWVISQLVAKSVVSSRPLSSSGRFSDEEPLNEELSSQDTNFNIY
ncbi:hypothetical protein CsSME_00051536 [Camellia sinensis var. sinensis]